MNSAPLKPPKLTREALETPQLLSVRQCHTIAVSWLEGIMDATRLLQEIYDVDLSAVVVTSPRRTMTSASAAAYIKRPSIG